VKMGLFLALLSSCVFLFFFFSEQHLAIVLEAEQLSITGPERLMTMTWHFCTGNTSPRRMRGVAGEGGRFVSWYFQPLYQDSAGISYSSSKGTRIGKETCLG